MIRSRHRRQRNLLLESLEPRRLLSSYLVSSLADPATPTPGTLRYAITQANNAGGSNTITFTPNFQGTITLTQGSLSITAGNLTLAGPGAAALTIVADTTSGDGISIQSTASAVLQGFTLANTTDIGIAADGPASISNCSFTNGNGAIQIDFLTTGSVANSTFSNNTYAGPGTAIDADVGAVSITNSTFTNNTSGGGAIHTDGGPLTITGCTFSDNQSSYGGAIDSNDGDVTVANSTFSSNAASANGGAIANTGGSLTVANCTFGLNIADQIGGAIDISAGATLAVSASIFDTNLGYSGGGAIDIESSSGTTPTITGCDFDGNFTSADGGDGAAIACNDGSLVLSDSTLSNNFANGNTTFGGGVFFDGNLLTAYNDTFATNYASGAGGGIANAGTAATLTNDTLIGNGAGATSGGGGVGGGGITAHNTIIAGSTNLDCGSDLVSSSSYNLIGDGTGALSTANHNLLGNSSTHLDPMIVGLANYGGAIFTAEISPASPAHNAGSNSLAIDQNGSALTTDARGAGYARIVGTSVDIGAFEDTAPTPTLLVEQYYHDLLGRTADSGSLAYWVGLLNAGSTSAQVAAGITSTAEYDGDLVDSYYVSDLGRHADSNGLNYWVGVIQSGTSPDTVNADILGSAEFVNSTGSNGTGGNATTYVTALYADILHRTPDSTGLNYWVSQLNAQTISATQVAYDFQQSTEYQSKLITADYAKFLDRTPTNTELTYFEGLLAGGTTPSALITDFVTSTEYYTVHDLD